MTFKYNNTLQVLVTHLQRVESSFDDTIIVGTEEFINTCIIYSIHGVYIIQLISKVVPKDLVIKTSKKVIIFVGEKGKRF